MFITQRNLPACLFNVLAGTVFFPAICLGTTWFELAGKMASDDNVYAYVIPYYDTYTGIDFKANHKDKLCNTTHYALNYNFNTAFYSKLDEKNYYNHLGGLNLEEDIGETLVATVSTQANLFNYAEGVNSKYDYLLLTTAAALRFYIFAFDFTSVDWGVEYSMYNLPNYNFEEEGWTPSLNFLEEVAEYNGFGTYLTVKQALPYTMDLELTGKIVNQFCSERPLFASAAQNDFLDEYRSDLESTLLLRLTRRLEKSSYVSLTYCSNYLQSNANAQVWDTSAGGVVLEDEYYRRGKTSVIFDSMYVFGQEMSYLRLYLTYRQVAYASRRAQEEDGTLLPDARADDEYSVLVEFNQRLGYVWKTNWVLKLAYQYTQNLTNDYYYNYQREVITLGVSSFLYL